MQSRKPANPSINGVNVPWLALSRPFGLPRRRLQAVKFVAMEGDTLAPTKRIPGNAVRVLDYKFMGIQKDAPDPDVDTAPPNDTNTIP